MAVRYPEVPQVADPAETHINHFCDQLINRINERRVELLTTVRDTRQEKDSRSAARARMEEELIALKSETLLKLQMNALRDTQQQILEQLEAKLVEATTPVPETRIVFRGDAQNLEQLIRGVGEILEEELKSNSEDNKCPFCFIRKPAGELLAHKQTCTMNPDTEPISTHQLSCQLTTNLLVDTMHDRATRCEFCGVYFTITEIGPHRNKCTFRRPALASKYRPSKRETKCKYCFEVFELEEVENHQNTCLKRHIVGEDKMCQHCYKMFSNDTISNHENTCPERQFGAFTDSSLESPFQDNSRGFKEKTEDRPMGNCPFCFIRMSAEELLAHKQTCTMDPEYFNTKPLRSSREPKSTQFEAKLLPKPGYDSINRTSKVDVKSKCKYCLEKFPNDSIFQHEKVCNLRNFSPVIDDDLNLPFHEHFPALDEAPKPTSEDNKCPFCKFPQPAMELDKHKATCQKNPKFREKTRHFENQTEISSVNSGPELVMSSRPIPVPHPRYQDREKNVPSSNCNPF